MKSILSGIQSTGKVTLGNYLGAFQNWLEMQKQYNCIFFVADLHSLTTLGTPEELSRNTFDVLAMLIASGIDPKHSTIFLQSHIPAHSELMWILNCFTYIGELNRMTQFKDKSQKNQSNINSGLLTYPVLMAADILLYQADLVPVGRDQKQHLEITRNLAERFNTRFGQTFRVPEPYISTTSAKIMSLQDPTSKMSKSDKNLNSTIFISDSKDEIIKKIGRAVTDSENLVKFDESRPGITNLINIYSSITKKSIAKVEEEFKNSGGYGQFKKAVAEVVADELSSINDKFLEVRRDVDYLSSMFRLGAGRAAVIANKTLQDVKDRIGLIK